VCDSDQTSVDISDGHHPRHVYAFSEEVEIVIKLGQDGIVYLARRKRNVKPANAKVATIRRVLRIAADHFVELVALWEEVHGKT